jgi:hypothetical protein
MEKEEEFIPSCGDLFDNPMINAAKQSMSPEIIEKYKELGKSMYKDLDFVNGTIENSIQDALKNIEEAILSGLHPSMLTDNEKAVLESEKGKEWYEKFGYVKEDLYDIITIKL